MKQKISLKIFCEEKGLNMYSKESQDEYMSYSAEIDKENGPDIEKIRKEAQEIKDKLSKKK